MKLNCFIEPETEKFSKDERQPASYIKKDFEISKPVKKAVVYMTALGVYKGFLNNEELSETHLCPGYTDYNYRVQYQSYDVTAELKSGKNTLGAVLGDGWYRGTVGYFNHRNTYGERLKFACRTEIEYTDGTQQVILSDKSWLASQSGAERENDLKMIEVYDFRREKEGGVSYEFPSDGWHSCKQSEYSGETVAQQGEKLSENEFFTPRIFTAPNGKTVLDAGENICGFLEIDLIAQSGRKHIIRFGETLDENGNFTQKNMSNAGKEDSTVGQKAVFYSSGRREKFKPLFLICGFRYAELENFGELGNYTFRAVAVYSSLKNTGVFNCSNEKINKLFKNIVRSQRSNFVDVPTDCPTRERAGWTADISVFFESCCYLTDPRKFIEKWLADYRAEQRENGSLPYVVPEGGYNDSARDCCGWSDAIANISMILYKFYGDKKYLSENYEAVKKYVEFNTERAKKKHPFFIFKRGAYRDFIIETGFHYGEWLEPASTMTRDGFRATFCPDTEVTTAWFYHTAGQLSEMAEILGYADDAEKYSSLAKNIKQAYTKEFVPVKSRRACRYVRPSYMGLLSADEKAKTLKRLSEMCAENDYKIATGFLSTYKLLPVLSENGYTETAYKILENEKRPGWLYEVNKGATSVWESWNGIGDDNVPNHSLNHYGEGSLCGWLFSECGGIKPLKAGFSEILLAPKIGGTLKYAACEYQSCKGLIKSRWELSGDEVKFSFTAPQGIKASVLLPDGTKDEFNGGSRQYVIKNPNYASHK